MTIIICSQESSCRAENRLPAEVWILEVLMLPIFHRLSPSYPPSIHYLSTYYPPPIHIRSWEGRRAIVVSEAVPARRLGKRLGSPQGQRR